MDGIKIVALVLSLSVPSQAAFESAAVSPPVKAMHRPYKMGLALVPLLGAWLLSGQAMAQTPPVLPDVAEPVVRQAVQMASDHVLAVHSGDTLGSIVLALKDVPELKATLSGPLWGDHGAVAKLWGAISSQSQTGDMNTLVVGEQFDLSSLLGATPGIHHVLPKVHEALPYLSEVLPSIHGAIDPNKIPFLTYLEMAARADAHACIIQPVAEIDVVGIAIKWMTFLLVASLLVGVGVLWRQQIKNWQKGRALKGLMIGALLLPLLSYKLSAQTSGSVLDSFTLDQVILGAILLPIFIAVDYVLIKSVYQLRKEHRSQEIRSAV